MTNTSRPILGELFERALTFGHRAHLGQCRKGGGGPYYAHPLQVAGIALEHGADEAQAAAALLHDVLEDTAHTYEDLAQRFGERVADIVRGCSDTEDHEDKGEWRSRKERYLAHLEEASADVALVSLADKAHNARSLVTDLRTHGVAYLDAHFKGKRDGTLWYYGRLAEIFARRDDLPAALRAELSVAVGTMRDLAGAAG